MSKLDYGIYDADNHYYESDDCYTRHIESRFKDKTVWVDRKDDGPARMYVGKDRCNFFSVAVGDHIGPPGIMKAFLKGETEEGGNVNLEPIDAKSIPEFIEKGARLVKMDEQGVDACLMLPTAGVGVEPQLRRDPELLFASLRAFNRWVEEDWGYGKDGRIYGAPVLSLVDLDMALVELDRVIEAGARFIVLTCGPVEGRSPGDPHFDPFWARCQAADMNVVYHIGSTSCAAAYNPPWGLRAAPPSHRHSFMEYALSFTDRPIVDTLTALIGDNVFDRFPCLRVLTVEYGAAWLGPMLRKLDHIARLVSKDMWRFGRPRHAPGEYFRQNIWVTPFYEDDVPGVANLIGAAHVLNGSDYPHPEGLAEPAEFVDELDGLSADAVRSIMRENLAGLVA